MTWTPPQRCVACGRELGEDWLDVELDTYTVCPWCAIPHLKSDDGASRVDWFDVPAPFAVWMREVIARHWSQRITVAHAYRRAA